MKARTLGVLLAAVIVAFVTPGVRSRLIAQTTAPSSNYIFRFNAGISAVFLGTTTFTAQEPISLGACTSTENIDGPLSCAVNCNGDSVCLLEVSGPPGAGVEDVLEKVSETPIDAASPSPTASPATGFESLAGLGEWLPGAQGASTFERRVEAYNSIRRAA